MDPNYLPIRASGVVPRAFSALAAAAHFGQRPTPLGRVGTRELEPLQFAPKPKHLQFGLESGFGHRGFRCQPAAKSEGELFEVGVGLGRGAEHLEAFVFAHGIDGGAGNCPKHTTSNAGFRLQTPGPVKNPRQDPLQGVISLEVDLEHLGNRLQKVR